MKEDTLQIRDLLYFDFDKAASIWSQFAGGLREKLAVSEDAGKNQNAGVRFGIPKIAEANLGTSYADKTSTLESRLLHHDLLNLLETQLEDVGLLLDVSTAIDPKESSPQTIRGVIGEFPYILATGASVIEDYQRIELIAREFNKLTEFINRCSTFSVEQSPEFQQLKETIAEHRNSLKKIKDPNQKARARAEIKALELNIAELTKSDLGQLDDWLLQGIRHWITTFVETRLNFRVYPFLDCPACHIICNLKRDCFVDQDLEHLLYGYGTQPNVALSVVGLITSLPPKIPTGFDPLAEFSDDEETDDKRSFEKAFRGLFGAMDGIEDFMRYSRYPNVTVHPIAVFRSFAPRENVA